MTDYNPDTSRLAASATALATLRTDYPAFRFSSEALLGRGCMYTAQRTDGKPGLHTIMTSDVAELRETLTACATGPA
jgi:hypothetical protein